MYKSDITTIFLAIFLTTGLYAEVDLQRGMYDAAEEMIRFDEKMNRAIAEHNQITPEEQELMQLNDMMINDFEETKNGYQLIKEILYPNETQVEVELKEGLLIITTTKTDKKMVKKDLNISDIFNMNSSTLSLLLPSDADENTLEKSYANGILKITVSKK